MKNCLLFAFIFIYSLSFCQGSELKVNFTIDSDEISELFKRELDSLVALKGVQSIEIFGYADTTGSTGYNLDLSQRRAENVGSYLIQVGMSPNIIENVRGKGESNRSGGLEANRVVRVNFDINTPKVDVVKVQEDEKSNESTQVKDASDHRAKTIDGELNQKTIEKLEVGDILNLGGIEFLPGRHVMTKSSEPALKKLIKVMQDNPSLIIEIQGHICCQTDKDGYDNDTGTQNLSENRAKRIYVVLSRAGISEDRMTFKGYGPFRKIVEEVDDKTRQRNRRVSIEILKVN